MQHSHDDAFNILQNTKKCIDTLSKGSQKFAKQSVFEMVGEAERKLKCKLADMSESEIDVIETNLMLKLMP